MTKASKDKTPKDWFAEHLGHVNKIRKDYGPQVFDAKLLELTNHFMSGAPTQPNPGECVVIAGAIALMRNILQAQDLDYKPPAESGPSKPRGTIVGAVAITVEAKDKPPAGSVTGTCSECGIKVHLAPSSQEVLREIEDARILCMKDDNKGCLNKAIDRDKKVELMMTPMGLEELRELSKRKP